MKTYEMSDEERAMVRRGEVPDGFKVWMGGVIVDPNGVAVGCVMGDSLPGVHREIVFADGSQR